MNLKTLPIIISLCVPALAQAQQFTTNLRSSLKVEIPLVGLFTPAVGWDDNDHIQAVAFGFLPNGCYSLAESKVEKVAANRFVIKQFANKITNGICADNSEDQLLPNMKVQVPFTKEIDIGTLLAGTYELDYLKAEHAQGTRKFAVEDAFAPMIDSAQYANVTQEMTADVLNGVERLKVTLKGIFNTSCTELERVSVVKEGDVYVLLPITRTKAGVACMDMLVPFQTTIDLGEQIPGNYLIHARSQNGKSVNHIVQVMR